MTQVNVALQVKAISKTFSGQKALDDISFEIPAEDFPLRLISSAQTKSGFGAGELKIYVSGNSAVIAGVMSADLDPLADAVREGLARQHAAPAQSVSPPLAQASDPYEALQKLTALRDAGILSPEHARKESDRAASTDAMTTPASPLNSPSS